MASLGAESATVAQATADSGATLDPAELPRYDGIGYPST
jgi:hypothetical protein